MTPCATLRLQLHAHFTFEHVRRRLPDYAALGVSHLYLSPITQAVPGSTHGYNVIDHQHISEELGGEDGFRRLARDISARGMGILLDIVPNHMAADVRNAWWHDVLQRGRDSDYAHFFDIDWRRGKVLLPLLSRPYIEALNDREISLDHAAGRVIAGGQRLPLAPGSTLPRAGDMPALHELLHAQHYQLAWWQEAAKSLNWRRFFDINELIGLRVEDETVFEASHALVLRLYAEGLVDGLRIDHIDGLAAPGAYLRRLRTRMQEVAPRQVPYLVVEKILAPQEQLDARWPVEGTTGYDFMDDVGALLHRHDALYRLAALWRELGGNSDSQASQLRRVRTDLLESHFNGEFQSLLRAAPNGPPDAVRAWLAAFPVYRSYAEDGGFSTSDNECWQHATRRATRNLGTHDRQALDAWLTRLRQLPGDAEALQRIQQLTPPLAAKSLEDTLHYRYMPLISRNEVGAWPQRFSLTADNFHARNQLRQQRHPLGLLATATHDHKRGEDARARLAVLSEMTNHWANMARDWLTACDPRIHKLDHYAVLQTMIGAWPVHWPPDISRLDNVELRAWIERITAWQRKALREGKLRSSWMAPDEDYEASAADSLRTVIEDPARFQRLARIAEPLVAPGLINSLAQTLLRCTSPGVPDLYQASALWDVSLVDPDNRQPSDAFPYEPITETVAKPDVEDWRSGRVKWQLLHTVLALRAKWPQVFKGDYLPLMANGPQARHVMAFARRDRNAMVVTAVPIRCALSLAGYAQGNAERASQFWRGTTLTVPHGQWQHLLDGEHFCGGTIALETLWQRWPVSLCVSPSAGPYSDGACRHRHHG